MELALLYAVMQKLSNYDMVNNMRGTVLIIEDEKEIGDLISLYLSREGIDTIQKETGEEGLAVLKKGGVDLLILDINLPGIDGFEVLQNLRTYEKLPVIIVSARIDDADMIMGFGYGADDFVQKPFSPKILAARVRAHLRRNTLYTQEEKASLISFGAYTLDSDALLLKKGAERISVSPKELEILIALAEKEGAPVSQEALYKQVWGNEFGDLTTVSVHIQRLRKKIETDSSHPQYIKTVYGFGYMFTSGGKE